MATPRLGDILFKAGLVNEEQLRSALEEQRRTGARLGEALVRLGFATEEDVARTLAEQLGLPMLQENQLKVDDQAPRLLPEAAARQYLAVPLHLDGDEVVVAMVDPLNVFALDDISFLAGKKARAAVITRQIFERLLWRVYRGQPKIRGAGSETLPLSQEDRAPARSEGLPREAPAEAPAVKLADELLQAAIDAGASDIHIEPEEAGVRVRNRLDGMLLEVARPPAEIYGALVSRLKLMASMDISERRVPQDGRIRLQHAGRDVDLRVSTLPTVFGEKLVIRVLDKGKAMTRLEDLGFSPGTLARYSQMIERPSGMILVTGPTGAGKTSTLTASLHSVNDPHKNILTIEDPVEYHVPGANQVQVNMKAGLTFASGLRSFLRQDPDVIMVGEIRDAETAETSIRAALTGHLVMTSLHTTDAPSAIARLVEMGVEPYLVASSVLGALHQRLARRLCPHCREPYPLTTGDAAGISLGLEPGRTFYRQRGCPQCNGSGYRGRVALFELLEMTPTVRQLALERAPAASLREQGLADGMRSLLEDAVDKAALGLTTLEEIQRVAFMEY